MNPTPKAAPAPLCPIPRRGIQGAAGIILHLFLLLASALLGVSATCFVPTPEEAPGVPEIFAAVAILLLVFHLWRATRTAKGTLLLLITVGAFLTFYTRSIFPAGLLCGLVFVVGEGSVLIATQKKAHIPWIPLIPLLAYGVTSLLSRDPIGALAVLVPWPAAWALASGTRRAAEKEDGPTRTGVICATALALGLSLAVPLVISLLRALGTLEPTVLAEALEGFRQELILSIHTQPMPEDLTPEMIELWEKMTAYESVENKVNNAFNLLPGACVVTVLIFSTACQSIQHAALRAFEFEACVTDRVKAFGMSLVSCVVFLIAYLAVMLDLGTTSTLSGVVFENIYLILLPGLALAGLLRVTRGLSKKGPRAMGCLFYVIILAFCLIFIAPFVLAAVEVIGHIFEAVTSKLKFDEDDDDPFGGS